MSFFGINCSFYESLLTRSTALDRVLTFMSLFCRNRHLLMAGLQWWEKVNILKVKERPWVSV